MQNSNILKMDMYKFTKCNKKPLKGVGTLSPLESSQAQLRAQQRVILVTFVQKHL